MRKYKSAAGGRLLACVRMYEDSKAMTGVCVVLGVPVRVLHTGRYSSQWFWTRWSIYWRVEELHLPDSRKQAARNKLQ